MKKNGINQKLKENYYKNINLDTIIERSNDTFKEIVKIKSHKSSKFSYERR